MWSKKLTQTEVLDMIKEHVKIPRGMKITNIEVNMPSTMDLDRGHAEIEVEIFITENR
jgi:hypothetical protein